MSRGRPGSGYRSAGHRTGGRTDTGMYEHKGRGVGAYEHKGRGVGAHAHRGEVTHTHRGRGTRTGGGGYTYRGGDTRTQGKGTHTGGGGLHAQRGGGAHTQTRHHSRRRGRLSGTGKHLCVDPESEDFRPSVTDSPRGPRRVKGHHRRV